MEQFDEENIRLYNSLKAFQIAAEESGSLVFIYDTRKQAIFVDEQTAKTYGVAVEQSGVPYEMVKRGLVSEDTREEYLRIHEAMIHGAREEGGIVKLVQADGSQEVRELKFRAILDDIGEPTGAAVGIYRRVTERYIRNMCSECCAPMAGAAERFSYRYDAAEDFMAIFVPASGERTELKEFSYPGFLSGAQKGNVCPESDFVILKDVLSEGTKEPVQLKLYSTQTKETHWYAMTANIAENKEGARQVFGTITDITDMKEQEKSGRRLEQVLQGMKDEYRGVFQLNLKEDTFEVLYDENEGKSGFLKSGCYSEMIRRIAGQVVAEEFRESFLEIAGIDHLRKALKEESRIELEYMTTEGNHKWRRNIYRVVELEDGEPLTVIMFHLDIDQLKTELLTQHQMLQTAYQYAESANAAKTEFLSRMSHDIRTPMNAIVGMTAIAGTNLDNPEKVKECLGKISSASRHLLSLINDVLDMSKIESGAIELQEEEFNLAALVDNMLNMIMPQVMSHGHTLDISIGNLKHEWVRGDSLRIQQAFVNLISNAVKYTPDGGIIRVSVEEKHSHSRNYGEYEFCFEDNGIGMTEEFQKVIFEPFSRAEDSRLSRVMGTGLGMAITRNLIRMMDGDIRVESKVDEGSKFTVTIHLKIMEDPEEIPKELLDLPVLVVDDDLGTCENACNILREMGMRGDYCLSGPKAVELARERHDREEDYFAVILDWQMPEMDGIATARELRRVLGPEIPIIFLTAYDWASIEEAARAAGVDRFLAKPLFRSRLLNSFRELVLPQQETEEDVAAFPSQVRFEGRHVLLAEDNDLNAEIATELLEMTGITVSLASDGREALDMMKCAPEGLYDMIFMDIQMPVMDGYEAAKAIRSLDRRDVKRIPIIAMTANSFAEDVNHALNAGMTEHISKPVDIQRLEAVLFKYLNEMKEI